MKYGKECTKTGIALHRDVYSEQFSEPGDIQFNYMVMIDGDCVDEDQNARKLAKRLREKADKLRSLANFLEKIGVSRPIVNKLTLDKE